MERERSEKTDVNGKKGGKRREKEGWKEGKARGPERWEEADWKIEEIQDKEKGKRGENELEI